MYNKSQIMKNAWNIKKTAGVSMSVALKSAWALEKAMVQAEEIAANKLDNARVRVNDWVKNGHNRTYIEVAVYTNAWNRKRTEKVGYVNNLTGEFVAAYFKEDKKMRIASIYNDADNVRMSVHWDENTGLITYKNVENGEEWDSDETAETLQEAIEDTYARYSTGWDLEIEEEIIENS